MSEFPIVLAALDARPDAVSIANFANFWSRAEAGGTVYFAHAIAHLPKGLEKAIFPFLSLGDDRELILERLLAAESAAVLSALAGKVPGAEAALRLAFGRVPDAVLEIGGLVGPTALVVGRGAFDGGSAFRFSDAARELARRAPCSVVFPAVSGKAGCASVGIAVDLTQHSVGITEFGVTLAHQFAATAALLHVSPTSDALDHARIVVDANAGSRGKKEIARLFAQVDASVQLPFGIASQLPKLLGARHTLVGDPGPELIEAARTHGLDTIVIGRARNDGGSGFRLGRVAEYVCRHFEGNVVIAPIDRQQPAT